MRKGKLFLLALAGLVLVATYAPVTAGSGKKTRQVIFLHTNDMHSKIDQLGKLAWLADSLRNEHRYLFLVAAGDNFTGNPIVDMYPEKGYPMVDLMNRVGFNLSAIGNHEFDLGQVILNQRRREAGFPFISANIDQGQSKLERISPYHIFKAGRVKIPVLGLIQLGENGVPDSHPSNLEGLFFTPANEKAADFLWLKKKYGSLLALTHLGIEGDEPLALAYPDFDLIIGGHSHTLMTKPLMANDVMIVQAGSQLRYVGKTTLHFTRKKVTAREFELIPLEAIKRSDKTVQDLIDHYNSNEEMNRVVALAGSLFDDEQELACMMTDAITHIFKTDFAFQNSGGVRISSLPEGEIRYKDIFRLDPFGNQVVIYSMTLDEIKSLIMNSFNRELKIDMLTSGMQYTVITGAGGKCVGVEMTDYQGNTFDQQKRYTVGMNSYIGASYTFDHEDKGNVQAQTTAQTLIDYLLEKGTVNYKGIKRVHVK